MGELAEIELTAAKIMDRVQSLCRDCPQAKLGALSVAEKVIKDEADFEALAESYADEIAIDCYGGNRHEDEPGMPFECWRGIRTPVTPPHLREQNYA